MRALAAEPRRPARAAGHRPRGAIDLPDRTVPLFSRRVPGRRTVVAMRLVEELPNLGFQTMGQLVPPGSTTSRSRATAGFSLQLGVYAQDWQWERIDADVGHEAHHEQLWWTFDLQGNVTDAGGDHDALLTALAGGPEQAANLFADHGTGPTYDMLKQKATEAVHDVIRQLP